MESLYYTVVKALDYDELANEIMEKLESAETVVFATSAGDRVTARTMCHVNDGLTILFGTCMTSEKTEQFLKNPNVAFVTGNLQMEAVAQNA